MTLFIVGGARSGKSRYAVAAQSPQCRVAFVATARADDPDMVARVTRHRAERPPDWITIEEPYDLVTRLERPTHGVDSVVVDCLTVWVANRQLRGDPDEAILDDARRLATLLASPRGNVTIVSNEVGAGVHPVTRLGLRFCDLLGAVNQEVARAAETVVLMVAGIPLVVKTPAALRVDAP